MYDVVVVGAGAAGLAAADATRRAGLRSALLEATARIGGRAHTDFSTFGVPFDRGCHWLHSGSINPFTRLAESYGYQVHRRHWQPLVHTGTAWATQSQREQILAFGESNFAAVVAAGQSGRDVAASEVIDCSGPWASLFEHWFTAISGTEPAGYSTLAYASDNDTNENWSIEQGYGALIARYGGELPVELDTPVRRIDWREPTVKLTTARGVLSAKTAILTVSTGVLAAAVIDFVPPLPDWKCEAIDAFPMGHANKIALMFDENVFDLAANSYAISLDSAPATMGFQIRPFGHPLAIGYLAGAYCSALEKAGPVATQERALEILTSMFGTRIKHSLRKTAATSWGTARYVRGAYSVARPGQAHRRKELAAPLEDRLFFAGEATSPDAFGTAHGAYMSGIAAARAAVRVVKAHP